MTSTRARAWVRPAFGARPINPFPADIILRFGLVALFALYMAVGGNRDVRLSLVVAAVIAAHALAATLAEAGVGSAFRMMLPAADVAARE